MRRRPALTNRVGLSVVGLLLFAFGGAALIRGLTLYPSLFGPSHTTVVDQAARTFTARNAWFWMALAATLFVIAVVSLCWLLAQSRRGAVKGVRIDHDVREGVTTLSTRALADALRDDLGGSPHLRHAGVKLRGGPASPRLHLTVTAEPDADPAAVRHGVHEALRRLHRAVDAERLPAVVYLRTGR